MIRPLKDSIKKVVFKFIKPPVQYHPNSYSQAGEDRIINFLLNGVGIHSPSYLELGVYSPDAGNNTYGFYLRGSKGVLVEADSTLIPKIIQIRPKDTVLNVGVGVSSIKEMDFYVFEEPSLSTFDKEEADFREANGSYKIEKVVKVELKSINEIIAENFDSFPDFLSIDIEGLDLEVLKTLDTKKYPIPIICAETCTYSENHIKPKDTRIAEYMLTKGYFRYADTYINSIFVHEEWFNSIRK